MSKLIEVTNKDMPWFSTEEVFHMPSAKPSFSGFKPHSEVNSSLNFEQKEFSRSKHAKREHDSRLKKVVVRDAKNKGVYGKLLKTLREKGSKNVPHAGTLDSLPFPEFLKGFKSTVSGVLEMQMDDTVRHTENFIILVYSISQSTSLSDYILAFVTYMKFYLKSSISSLMCDVLEYVFDNDEKIAFGMGVQSGVEFVPHSLDMQSLKDSWEMLKTNTVFNKIAYLITVAMASSICSFKNIEFNFAGINIIRLEALKQQANASDILDALVNTFSWLADTGWCCIKEKSLAPILYSDQRLKKYTEECNYVISMGDAMKAGNVPDIQEYERQLDDCLITTCKLQKVTPSVAVKELLQRKYAVLVNIKNDLIAKRKNTSYRFAPIGWSISGESSIGKSEVAEITMKLSLTSMGFSDEKAGICTLNESDKYDSTITSDIVGIFIDDANNTKSQFVEKAPSTKYIQIFNNVQCPAVKAELNEKGVVFYEFKCGVLTTNTKTLGANLYSNWPASILRRFIHVSVEVKEKYRKPGGTSLDVNHPDIVNSTADIIDVWEFTIEEVVPDGSPMGTFKVLTYTQFTSDGALGKVPCYKLNLEQYCEAVIYFSQRHKQLQEKQVRRITNLATIRCCTQCNKLPQFCKCAQPHSLLEAAWAISTGSFHDYAYTQVGRVCSHVVGRNLSPGLSSQVVCAVIEDIMSQLTSYEHAESSLNWIPRCIIKLPCFRLSLIHHRLGKMKRFYVKLIPLNKYLNRIIVVSLPLLAMFYMLFPTWSHLLWMVIFYSIIIPLQIVVKNNIDAERQRLNDMLDVYGGAAIEHYGRILRQEWKTVAAGAVVSIAGIVTALQVWNSFRKIPHSLTNPKSFDAKPGWFGFTMETTGAQNISSEVRNATPSQMCNTVSKNVAWGRFIHPNGIVNICSIFFPRKSVMLVPHHIFYVGGDMTQPVSEELIVEVWRSNKPGGKFEVRVNLEMSYKFPHLDMVGIFVPNCPDIATLTHLLPVEAPTGRCMGTMVSYRKMEREFFPISAAFGPVCHSYKRMYGCSYKTPGAQLGACMSPIVSECKQPAVVAFHIGGDATEGNGIGQVLTKIDYDHCERWLDKHAGFISAHAFEIPEGIPKVQMGVETLVSYEPHPKAVFVKNMDFDHNVVVVGQTNLRSKMISSVKISPISRFIEEEIGIMNEYGKPPLNQPGNWHWYNVNIDQFAKPSKMFCPKLLRRAQLDWLDPVIDAIRDQVQWDSNIRPLTIDEAVNGIDGVKFIDSLKMNTGIGFPLFGKKNKKTPDGVHIHFDEIIKDDGKVMRRMNEHIRVEYERLLDCYRRNQRGYPVTSATLKDEPTKLGKDKVRVFQAAPVALSILIRQYFLTLARFFCCNPITVESAVGVNAFSKDWEELMDHACKYAENGKMLAWDYSKYDVRMNSQITRKVWESFIILAQIAGYSDEDISIMKAMIADICHPLIDMNGTMLMSTAMNTSGNNMTVFVNSVAGSLYVRMGFFHMYPHLSVFRDYVSLLTYGDDAIGSCVSETHGFNFISFRDFLSEHGMKLTLPSKTDDEIDFLDFEDTDFLKRKSFFIPEIGCHIGQLDEDSIWKSLHCNMISRSCTPKEVSCSCVEGALHEWFAFGRNHYEMRRMQMKRVCELAQLPVAALDITYDERVDHWIDKYERPRDLPQIILLEDGNVTPLSDVHPMSPHSGSEEDSVVDLTTEVDLLITTSTLDGATNRNFHTYLGEQERNELMQEPLPPDTAVAHLIGRSMSSAHERTLGFGENNQTAGGDASIPVFHEAKLTLAQAIKLVQDLPRLEYIEQHCYEMSEHEWAFHMQEFPGWFPYSDYMFLDPEQIDEAKEMVRLHQVNTTRYRAIRNMHHHFANMQPHSAIDTEVSGNNNKISDADMAAPSLETANIHFHDAHPGYMDDRGTGTDVIRETLEDESVSLNRYFARPIKIGSYTWQMNQFINVELNPWELFFENKRIINRLSNYKQMKCNLHIKVVLNGSPMHYGRALVSYRPLHTYDTRTRVRPNNLLDPIAGSQRPHFWINPTISQGGSLCLPFFTPWNMIDIPAGQWREMGLLNIMPLTILKHANGADSPITISVFAWAENVVLAGLTQTNPTAITPQSGTENAGIISKPASNVAKWASHLSDIPRISKFAKATELGARSIAYMATLFGYSKPAVENILPHHVTSNDGIAVCDGIDNCVKLSIDSKQELTIDPTIAGLDNNDELAINSIATRESYLTRFVWMEEYAPEDRLFSVVVDPVITVSSTETTAREIHMPACAFAGTPFKYWRGSMRYRFQICSSTFHKGRLKIVWDPFQAVNNSEYNTTYTHIIDIAEQNDFTVEVGWGQTTSWRKCLFTYFNNDKTITVSTDAITAPDLDYNAANASQMGNGVLSAYIVNSLTSPNSTINNGVVVLVSVSACDDMEFAVPNPQVVDRLTYQPLVPINGTTLAIPDISAAGFGTPLAARLAEEVLENAEILETNISPQSGTETDQKMTTPVESYQTYYMGSRPVQDGVINKIYMGETILSFRTLLKRYNYHETLSSNPSLTAGGHRIHVWYRNVFPTWPTASTRVSTASSFVMPLTGGVSVYPCSNTCIHYVTSAFGGWRGGMRYMLDGSNIVASTSPTYWHVYRLDNNGEQLEDDYVQSLIPVNTDKHTLRNALYGNWPPANSPVATWNTMTNPQMKIEIPYQTLFRFCPAKWGNRDIGTRDIFQNVYEWETILPQGDRVTCFHKYVAAAEDFQCLFYLGPPVFFIAGNFLNAET